MARRLCLVTVLCLLSYCRGLDLTLNLDVATEPGDRPACGVLTCEESFEDSNSTTPENDQARSSVSFRSISTMSVSKRSVDGENIREVLVASVSSQVPSVTKVSNGRKIDGHVKDGRASLRVEFAKPADCQAEYSCEAQGQDTQGREAVRAATLVQQASERESQVEDSSSLPDVSTQLLASIQTLLNQSVAGLEDKIGDVKKDVEVAVGNKVSLLSTGLEAKISTEISQLRAEINADLSNSLESLRQEMHDEQREALRNFSTGVEKALDGTSSLLLSVESGFELMKSNGQETLLAVRNKTETIREMLASGDVVSQCLWNSTAAFTKDLLKIFRDAETKTGPTVCERGMAEVLTDKQPTYVKMTDDTIRRQVLCDTQTDQGGWILIQRRSAGDVDFYKTWASYREGFGSLDGDFYLGNDAIHELTEKDLYELRIDFVIDGQEMFAEYSNFSIEDESNKYRLHLGSHSGTVGELIPGLHGLSYSDGKPFSTFDQDNDALKMTACAKLHHGAWWYGSCMHSNLNGGWGQRSSAGVCWYDGVTWLYPSSTEMKVRRV